MANTYSQLHVQLIFVVDGRQNLIAENNRESVEKYICGIISANKCKPLAIYTNPDHTHVLLGLNPSISVADLARNIKANSSRFINEKGWMRGKFNWQKGYGAFSYSKSQIDSVIKYILRQPEHHKRLTFKEEYLKMLQKAEITYDEKYLFDWYD